MLRTALGHAEGLDTRLVASKALASLSDALQGDTPAAMLLFASTHMEQDLLVKAVTEAYPGTPLAGCTTAGEFSSELGMSDDSALIIAFVSDTIRFASGAATGASIDPEASIRKAWGTAMEQLGEQPRLCFCFPEGYLQPASRMLRHIIETIPEECLFIGAQAASHPHNPDQQPFEYHDSGAFQDGISFLVLAGPLETHTIHCQSWSPLGEEMEVTEAEGPEVRSIGNTTALQFYRKYLGTHAAPMQAFPFAVHEKDFDHHFMRGPVAHDEAEGSIRLSGDVPVGSKIRLTQAQPQKLLEDLHETFRSLPADVSSGASMLLMISCAARRSLLGSRAAMELETVRHALPCKLPIAGLFGFGEIGPFEHGGRSYMHNHTLVATFIGAKDGGEKCLTSPKDENASPDRPFIPPSPEHDNEFLQRKLERALMDMRLIEDQRNAGYQLMLTMQENLRQSEERHRRIVETSAEGFLLMDKDMAVTYVNDAWLRMTGLARGSVIGSLPDEFLQAGAGLNLPQTTGDSDHGEYLVETGLLHKSGETVPVLVHANRLTGDTGQLLGYCAFFSDLTEQKKALRVAGQLQQSLLPTEAPVVPGLDLAGRSVPCDEVGGDYFDYLCGDDDAPCGLVVADVSGHGVDASLLMSAVRSFLRSHPASATNLGQTISRLNGHLALDLAQTGRFVTLFHLLADMADGSLAWVRAGHDPAWLYCPSTDEFTELVGDGLPLGVLEDTVYSANQLERPEKGAVLVLATDGIWETRNTQDEMFGKTRLRQIIRSRANKPASAIRDAIFDAVQDFAQGVRIDDDLTVLVARFV